MSNFDRFMIFMFGDVWRWHIEIREFKKFWDNDLKQLEEANRQSSELVERKYK